MFPSKERLRGSITQNFGMASISWLKVGGPADWLFQPADHEDLQEFMRLCPEDMPILPIGVCSNMIIREGGLPGVVIRMGRGFNEIRIEGDYVYAGAAALDAHVARKAAKEGIDLAFLRTIPGAIGGAIKMNAGCYGEYVADHLVEVRAITRDGALVTLAADELSFGYRSSDIPDGMVIIEAVFKGRKAAPEEVEAKMDAALAKREETQPVKERSCGSTFRNPAGFSSTGRADDVHDLKAWKLIDDAGLRGYRLGGAEMSEKHPNFLINKDGATAEDLEALGEYVRKKVLENSGITLEWEIMRVGKPRQE